MWNDPSNPPGKTPPDGERLLVLLAYGLFLIAPPFGGLSGLVGVVIAHIRLDHARGTLFESHYRNQIRVFWTMLLAVVACLAALSVASGASILSLFWPFGWPWHLVMLGASWMLLGSLFGLVMLILLVWYYWRLVAGFVRALDDKPF